MEQVTLGSDLTISSLGFGGWAIGGIDWGPVDDKESLEAVSTALRAGVSLFDTADFYGFGHGERVMIQGLQGATATTPLSLATKGGVRWEGEGENIRRDGSPAYLRQALEASLKRMGIEAIDLYQLHWPDPDVPLADSIGALMDLKAEGKIRHVGVCNLSPEELKIATDEGEIVSHQLPLSLLDRSSLPAIEASKALGVSVLAYSPLGMGILTGKYVAQQIFTETDVRGWFPYFRGDDFRANIELAQGLQSIALGEGKTPGQIAIRWALETPGVGAVLVGARRPSQVKENLGAAGWRISERAKAQIETLLAPKPTEPAPDEESL